LIDLILAVGSGTFAIAAFSHHDKKAVKRDHEEGAGPPGRSRELSRHRERRGPAGRPQCRSTEGELSADTVYMTFPA
jgi:hypothetical protein